MTSSRSLTMSGCCSRLSRRTSCAAQGQTLGLVNRLHRNDPERPGDAVMFCHRHVLADLEGVLVQAKDRLVVLVAHAIGENPAVAMMLQPAVLVFGMLPEPAHRAGALHLGPFAGVEPAVDVKRRLEFVAAGPVAVGKLWRARQLEVDLLQAHHSSVVEWPIF